MSYYDYRVGLEVSKEDYPFYALIQAAMRQADTDNLESLKLGFPHIWKELKERYNSPHGLLPGEPLEWVSKDNND